MTEITKIVTSATQSEQIPSYADMLSALAEVFRSNAAFTTHYGADPFAYENFIVDLLMAGQEYETVAKLPSGTYSISVSAAGRVRGAIAGSIPVPSTKLLSYVGQPIPSPTAPQPTKATISDWVVTTNRREFVLTGRGEPELASSDRCVAQGMRCIKLSEETDGYCTYSNEYIVSSTASNTR